MVQVLKQEPDKLYEIGEGQFVGEMLFLEVSIFDILRPIVDTVLQVNKKITKIVQAVS